MGWHMFGSILDVFDDFGGAVSAVVKAAEGLFGEDDGPDDGEDADEPKPPPYPGTAPGTSPYPSPAPVAPVAPPGPAAGGLPAGVQAADDQYTALVGGLSATDQKLAEVLRQIFAANVEARNRVVAILTDLQHKAAQVGPELGDPAAVRAYQQYVDDKLGEIQQILDDARVDGQTKALILAALGAEYRASAPRPPDAGAGPGGGDGGGGDSASDRGADTTTGGGEAGAPADGGQDRLVDPLAGMGSSGPAAGMDPWATMGPALAGLGGLPGALGGLAGAGLPLGGLVPGLGAPAGPGGPGDGFGDRRPTGRDSTPDDGFVDEPADHHGRAHPGGAEPAAAPSDPPGGGHDGSAAQQGQHDAGAAGGATPAAAAPVSAPGSGDPARSVTLPDGSVVTAPSRVAASAIRAVLQGTGVTAAYQALGVQLPPPGTPVTDPVDPAHLEPGCVARFASREPVMAVGNGKIWLDGQLQPLGALGSGSDFLGWSKPPAPPTQPVTGAAT